MRSGWRLHAACFGEPTEWWFANAYTEEAKQAQAICITCPVKSDCAAEAHQLGEWGRWGRYSHLNREVIVPLEVRCDRCREIVVLYRDNQLERCDRCLADDVRGRDVILKRQARVTKRQATEAKVALEAFLVDLGVR